MLIGSDENNRAPGWRNGCQQIMPIRQICRQTKVENINQLTDSGSRAGTTEDDLIIIASPYRSSDNGSRLFSQRCGLRAGEGGLRMRVGIQRQHLPANKVFEKVERPARRCVIGINQRLGPECSLDTAAFPDDVFPYLRNQRMAHGLLAWFG